MKFKAEQAGVLFAERNFMIELQESATAKLCSFARAFHSNFAKEKIFDDYLAFDLMGKEEYEEVGQLIGHDFHAELFDPSHTFCKADICEKTDRLISPIPLSRAAFAERELQRFAHERGSCQYVICGAGMDTFAFRNTNGNISVFEIDHPDTQRYKLDKIKKLCRNIPENVRFAAVDFMKDDMLSALVKAGFDPSKPSFFALLGVSYYLDLTALRETISKIAAAASFGSMLCLDFPDETTLSGNSSARVSELSKITAFLGEPMKYGYSAEEICSLITENGFIINTHETPKDIQRRFFSKRKDGLSAFENVHFILAQKGDSFNYSFALYI